MLSQVLTAEIWKISVQLRSPIVHPDLELIEGKFD